MKISNKTAEEFVRGRFGEILIRKPRKKGQLPAVILVQGFGMTRHENKNSHDGIAQRLAANGFLTVQFDFSYERLRSGSAHREIPLSQRAGELDEIISLTRERREVDRDRIGILAMSFGVSTVLLSGLSGIRSLCLVSGIGFRPSKFIRRYIEKGAIINKNGDPRLPRSSGITTVVGADFWESFDGFRQEDRTGKIGVPVLIIYGKQDAYIAKEDTEAVIASVPKRHRSVRCFPAGDHGIIDVPRPMREEFLQAVTDWFGKSLKEVV